MVSRKLTNVVKTIVYRNKPLMHVKTNFLQISKDDAADLWTRGNEFVKSLNDNRKAPEDPDLKLSIDRRVKEEIDKVFQEFKEKQERGDEEALNDPWKETDLKHQNKIPDRADPPKQYIDKQKQFIDRQKQYADEGLRNGRLDDDFQRRHNDFNDNQRDNNVVEMNGNRDDDFRDIDDGNAQQDIDYQDDNKGQDMGDHYEEVMENVMDIINEDREREELEIEDEIEHRLAEVLKDAVNEVADEQMDQDQVSCN